MEENIKTYKWILIKKETQEWLPGMFHNADEKPPCGEPDKLEWVEWGKELPEDIDSGEYKLIDGELVKQ